MGGSTQKWNEIDDIPLDRVVEGLCAGQRVRLVKAQSKDNKPRIEEHNRTRWVWVNYADEEGEDWCYGWREAKQEDVENDVTDVEK